MTYDTATPYVASYVVIRNEKGEIAFVLRSNTSWMNDHYGLPSGKVEKDEPYTLAAIREAKEEIGIDIKAGDLMHIHTAHRRSTDSDWVDVYFETKKWTGKPYNAEPHKHSALAWLDPRKLPKNVIPSVSFALEQILLGNNYAEHGWEQ